MRLSRNSRLRKSIEYGNNTSDDNLSPRWLKARCHEIPPSIRTA
jgi:hypothetical protein